MLLRALLDCRVKFLEAAVPHRFRLFVCVLSSHVKNEDGLFLVGFAYTLLKVPIRINRINHRLAVDVHPIC